MNMGRQMTIKCTSRSNPPFQVSEDKAYQSIQAFIRDARKRMLANKLKINDRKTEFVIIGSKHNLSQLNINDIKIGDAEIKQLFN